MTTSLSPGCFIVYKTLASPAGLHALVALMLQTASTAKPVQLSIPALLPPWVLLTRMPQATSAAVALEAGN